MSLSRKEVKEEANIVKAAMLEADQRAKERREEAEFNEKHGIKTPEDSERFIQQCKDEIFAKTAKFGKVETGKKSVPALDKKKCVNCKYSKWLVRQYDETKTKLGGKIFWTDEYWCTNCKERMRL